MSTWDAHDDHVLALVRRTAGETLLCLFNFTGQEQTVWLDAMEGTCADLLTGETGPCARHRLGPYQYAFRRREDNT